MHRKRLVHSVCPVGAGCGSWSRDGAAEAPCRRLRREPVLLDHTKDLLEAREAARRVLQVQPFRQRKIRPACYPGRLPASCLRSRGKSCRPGVAGPSSLRPPRPERRILPVRCQNSVGRIQPRQLSQVRRTCLER